MLGWEFDLSMSRREYLQSYFDRGVEFHSYLSPGLVVGIFMVDLAKEILGPCDLIDAVVETKACVPDAIQLMTHCTYGNGWMVVKDWGKMALTLYPVGNYPILNLPAFVCLAALPP